MADVPGAAVLARRYSSALHPSSPLSYSTFTHVCPSAATRSLVGVPPTPRAARPTTEPDVEGDERTFNEAVVITRLFDETEVGEGETAAVVRELSLPAPPDGVGGGGGVGDGEGLGLGDGAGDGGTAVVCTHDA